MINFDDSLKNRFLYAKPILIEYGIKATFFEVCGWIGKPSERKSWQDIAALKQDGADLSFSKDAAHTTVNLFNQEMRYLHDNGFKVLATSNLGYNSTRNSLYIKSVSSGGTRAA